MPVLGRGCGTGLAGQSVNAAVVFDFSKYMREIVHLDPQARTARVRPGVICDQLRDAAATRGLTFAVDPATHSVGYATPEDQPSGFRSLKGGWT